MARRDTDTTVIEPGVVDASKIRRPPSFRRELDRMSYPAMMVPYFGGEHKFLHPFGKDVVLEGIETAGEFVPFDLITAQEFVLKIGIRPYPNRYHQLVQDFGGVHTVPYAHTVYSTTHVLNSAQSGDCDAWIVRDTGRYSWLPGASALVRAYEFRRARVVSIGGKQSLSVEDTQSGEAFTLRVGETLAMAVSLDIYGYLNRELWYGSAGDSKKWIGWVT